MTLRHLTSRTPLVMLALVLALTMNPGSAKAQSGAKPDPAPKAFSSQELVDSGPISTMASGPDGLRR